jgi:hypothetical protein
MRFRKLRIAWSVAWGIACLLLVALWVRSYQWNDIYSRLNSNGWVTTFGSDRGCGYLFYGRISPIPASGKQFRNLPSHGWRLNSSEARPPVPVTFQWQMTATRTKMKAPFWFVTLILAGIGILPWLSYRFSLRTLLIVMTLVAVAMGWAVYAVRQ